MMRVTFDERNVRLAASIVEKFPKLVNRAMYASVTRTLTTTRKAIGPIVHEKYTAKQRGINHVVALKKMRGKGFVKGTLEVTGKMIPLSDFQMKVPGKRKNMVRVKVKRESSMQPVKGLFVNRTKKGWKGGMQRRQKARYPLAVPYGPSIPQMVGSREALYPLISIADKELNSRFLHEIQWRLSKV